MVTIILYLSSYYMYTYAGDGSLSQRRYSSMVLLLLQPPWSCGTHCSNLTATGLWVTLVLVFSTPVRYLSPSLTLPLSTSFSFLQYLCKCCQLTLPVIGILCVCVCVSGVYIDLIFRNNYYYTVLVLYHIHDYMYAGDGSLLSQRRCGSLAAPAPSNLEELTTLIPHCHWTSHSGSLWCWSPPLQFDISRLGTPHTWLALHFILFSLVLVQCKCCQLTLPVTGIVCVCVPA